MPKVALLKFVSDIYISPVFFQVVSSLNYLKVIKYFQGSVYFSHFIALWMSAYALLRDSQMDYVREEERMFMNALTWFINMKCW